MTGDAGGMLLLQYLDARVPATVMALKGTPRDILDAIGRRAQRHIVAHADEAMFGKGEAAREAADAIVRALAVLALTADGGVTFAGRHWCSTPPCQMCLAVAA